MSFNTSVAAFGLCGEISTLFNLNKNGKIDDINVKRCDLKRIETWFNSSYEIMSLLSMLSLAPMKLVRKDSEIELKVRGLCTVARICLLKLCTKLVIGCDTTFPENNVLEGIYDKDSHGVPTIWKLYPDDIKSTDHISVVDYSGQKYMYVYDMYDKNNKSSPIFKEITIQKATPFRDGNQYLLLTDKKINYNIEDNDRYNGLIHFVDFSRLVTDTY